MTNIVAPLPLIGVTACLHQLEPGAYHIVGDKYLTAVTDGAGGLPVVLPALGAREHGGRLDIASLVDRLDGLCVTGSPSNVEPHHYDGTPSRPGTLHDPERDRTTLPLIRAAIGVGLPVLAICRGIQELNVALGGSLHQHLHEVSGKRDHRARQGVPPDVKYGPVHAVRLMPGGVLAGLAAGLGLDPAHVMVNSLHGQAIDRPAPRLIIEAESEDGVIEAVRVADAPAFAIGVQWHAEYKVRDNPLALALFEAFGEACRARAGRRQIAHATLAREAAE